jgi:alpha-D-xyloside xylohydrolase
MKELIVRWYQFGLFSPVFRTHGCRNAKSEPNTDTCKPAQGSCGFNEVWSYGNDTQVLLEKYVRMRSAMKPYLQELDKNVTAQGVPTMRPLAYEFPADAGCRGIDDQYLFGPALLVAPVTVQNATTRSVYFPAGASWEHYFTGKVVKGGQRLVVDAPLGEIPAYKRR